MKILLHSKNFTSNCRGCFAKKGFLENFTKFTGKYLCQSLFFDKVAGMRPATCNFIKKETPAHVFSYKFCEIFKNTFFYGIPSVAASEISLGTERDNNVPGNLCFILGIDKKPYSSFKNI